MRAFAQPHDAEEQDASRTPSRSAATGLVRAHRHVGRLRQRAAIRGSTRTSNGSRRASAQVGNSIANFSIDFAFRIDPLSSTMLMIVTWIGFLIHVYATGYMSHEKGYTRFFTYLNLFMFMMLLLVLGANYIVMFVGWEGVGLCSYLLIGFYYDKNFAADAGKKAFITNRIGDFGFILGIFLIFNTFGSADYEKVFALAAHGGAAAVRLDRHGDLPAAVRRRVRQVRAGAAVRLAAGRDGRPDAGLRADPRRDDGHRRRLHGRPLERAVPACRPTAIAGRGHRRRGHGDLRGDDRPRAERHQESPRVLDGLAARLHVPRRGRRRVHRGDLPRHDARVLQGLPLPRRRLGHSRLRRRAGHAQDGRPAQVHAATHRTMLIATYRDRGHAAAGGLLLEGRDPRERLRLFAS